jgi:hypothetical protein
MSSERKDITTSKSGSLQLDFGTSSIDLSNLPPDKRAEIEMYAARKKIDLMHAVHEMQKDLQATAAGMNTVADVTRRMAASGDAVTIRQTIKNAAGTVEVVGGNTEEARQGKTSSAIDRNTIYIVGGIAAAIVVALILSN